MSEPRTLEDLTPARVLIRRFELEAEFAGASTLGFQLQALKQGVIGSGHNGDEADTRAEKRHELAMMMIITRDLTRAEVDICRLRYWTLTRPETYEKARRPSDMHEGCGEEVIAPRALDGDGKEMEGFVLVRGVKQKLGSYAAVAERLRTEGATNKDGTPISAGGAERRLKDALDKVAFALRAKQFQEAIEEKYE